MMIQQIFTQARLKPRRLFLIDSLGAMLSAVLYGGLLAQFQSTFGLPADIAYGLAVAAGAFAIYSGICYLLNLKKWQPYLKVIAVANLLHCGFTIGLAGIYYQEITLLGILYFSGEWLIVISLALVEWRTASGKFPDRD